MADKPINLLPEGFDDAFADFLKDDGDESTAAAAKEEDATTEEGAEEGTTDGGGEEVEGTEGEEGTEDGEEEEGAEGEEGAEEGAEGEEAEEEEGTEGEEVVAGKEPVGKTGADEDTLSRLARLISESNKATESKNDPGTKQSEAEEEPDLYTEDERKLLEEYEKEWPEVAQAEQLRRRAEYREVVGYVFNEIAQQIGPMAQMVQALSERTHLQDLHEAVGDYDVVREDVVSWVEEQPAYLQSAYKHVIDNGTVDEVADLIYRFKSETGRSQPEETKKTEKPARKKETELPATTKKAAASLAPVSSKRSVVPQGEDPSDFESAFEQFAGKP